MMDPPRAGVRDAVAACHGAGIRVVMITGDHAITARAIAHRLGIAGSDAKVLTGTDLAAMSGEQLRDRVGEVSVYARVSPEEKLRIVHALAFEPGEKGVLRRSPRHPAEGVLSRLLWERTLLAGLVMAAGTLMLFRWELDLTNSLARAQTVALTTMVIFMAFHAGNARSETTSLFRLGPILNPFLFVATVATVGVHVAALYFSPTQYILRVEPIELAAWVRIVAVAPPSS